MAIMIGAKATSSTEGANHDIMSVSDIVMRRDEKYMELLEQIEDYWTDRAEEISPVNQEELAVITGQTGDGNWNVISGKQNK